MLCGNAPNCVQTSNGWEFQCNSFIHLLEINNTTEAYPSVQRVKLTSATVKVYQKEKMK